jgi:hypothetical protein
MLLFKNMKRVSILFAAFITLTLPLAASAACDPSSSTLCSPTLFSDIPSFIAGFLRAVVTISLPIISLFIVYSGFLFVFARGNPGALETARNNFLWVIIGSILILGAWVLATLIGGTVSQLMS